MSRLLLMATALISMRLPRSTYGWPELNPALEKYQDVEKCFPLTETWYMVYRNYESDPVFGGATKCLKFSERGPPVDGKYPIIAEFGNQTTEATITLHSSDGYTTKNIMNLSSAAGDVSLHVYASYLDSSKCSVVRETYVNGEHYFISGHRDCFKTRAIIASTPCLSLQTQPKLPRYKALVLVWGRVAHAGHSEALIGYECYVIIRLKLASNQREPESQPNGDAAFWWWPFFGDVSFISSKAFYLHS